MKERTKLRVTVAAVGVLIAIALAAVAFGRPSEDHSAALLMHLAVVFLELALTFAIVDAIFERGRERESARKMAVRALNDLHHHVWVWQGGHRDVSVPELIAILEDASRDESVSSPVAEFTQNLFMELGSKAANSFRIEPEIVARNPHLANALNELV